MFYLKDRHFFDIILAMVKRIKKLFSKNKDSQKLSREELEKKAIESAKNVAKEYKRVFERLAEYDRV